MAGTRVGQLETGVIYRDDNLDRLSQMPSESVDLIYLDPPFFSNRSYEVIWGDEAEVRSFEDRWDGGIEHYIEWMRHRVIEMRRLLKPTGQLFLHCDYHANAHLRIMLDDIFGRRSFLDEIVWHYETASGAPKKTLLRNHDTIYRYAAGKPQDVTWNAPRVPWPEKTLAKWQKDEEGRIYHAQNQRGKRYYIDPAGKLRDDVWNLTLSARARERLGYPTQKPEALLERIVASASNEGDVVLDPFCGCGTTLVAALRLKREWIGIDVSPTAVRLMNRRVLRESHGQVAPKLVGMPITEEELYELKPFEFQNWIIAKVWGTASPRKSRDGGIDGFSFMTHDPIQIKRSWKVGRNVVDNFETAMRRVGSSKGYIVAFSFTRDAKEEIARARWKDKIDVELVTVKRLLDAKDERLGPMMPVEAQVVELPLAPPRAHKDLPTGRQLEASDRAAIA